MWSATLEANRPSTRGNSWAPRRAPSVGHQAPRARRLPTRRRRRHGSAGPSSSGGGALHAGGLEHMAELGLGQRRELLEDVEAAPASSASRGRRRVGGLGRASGSAAWAGPHGRAAACHWAPSARAARAECVAQPRSREPQPRDGGAAGCGTAKTARGASRRTVQGRGSRPGRPPAPRARCRSAARARPSAPPWARPPSPSTRSGSGSPARVGRQPQMLGAVARAGP